MGLKDVLGAGKDVVADIGSNALFIGLKKVSYLVASFAFLVIALTYCSNSAERQAAIAKTKENTRDLEVHEARMEALDARLKALESGRGG